MTPSHNSWQLNSQVEHLHRLLISEFRLLSGYSHHGSTFWSTIESFLFWSTTQPLNPRPSRLQRLRCLFLGNFSSHSSAETSSKTTNQQTMSFVHMPFAEMSCLTFPFFIETTLPWQRSGKEAKREHPSEIDGSFFSRETFRLCSFNGEGGKGCRVLVKCAHASSARN